MKLRENICIFIKIWYTNTEKCEGEDPFAGKKKSEE